MKEAPEWYDDGVGWLYSAGRAFAFAATLGMGALGGFAQQWWQNYNRPQHPRSPYITLGLDKVDPVDHVEIIDGVRYKITEKAAAYLAHGFHRMELCGAEFTEAQRNEIYHTADEDKDLMITEQEGAAVFAYVLDPTHPLGQKMLPLEKRVKHPYMDAFSEYFALLRSKNPDQKFPIKFSDEWR